MSPGLLNKVPEDPTILQPPQPLFKLSMHEAERLVDQFASQVSQQLQSKEKLNQHESGCKHCDHCGSSINKQALQLLKQMGLIVQSPRSVEPRSLEQSSMALFTYVPSEAIESSQAGLMQESAKVSPTRYCYAPTISSAADTINPQMLITHNQSDLTRHQTM